MVARRLPLACLAATLLLAVLVPSPAAGHASHGFSAGQVAEDVLFVLSSGDTLLVTSLPTSMLLTLSNASTSLPLEGRRVNLTVTSPSNATVQVPLPWYVGTGAYQYNLTFSERGIHRARATADPPGASVEFEFEVFPNRPYRVDSPDAIGESRYTNKSYTMHFALYKWPSGAPKAGVTDATARVEHWSNDHSTMLWARNVSLEESRAGVYRLRVDFPEPGMYHLWFVADSIGMAYQDTPWIHIVAFDDDGDEPTRPTPGLSAVGVLAGLAAAVWTASARRARP